MKGRVLVAFMAALAASCGARLMKLPAGPGAPLSPDAASAVLDSATAACRTIRTLTAEVGVSGSAAGHRMRGRLLAGVARPASARLEAVAPFGQPMFILAATGDDATLLLPRDRRVLEHAPPAEVLDAVAGVPLDAADLFTTLTGCAPDSPATRGVAFGDDWRMVATSSGNSVYEAYLHRGNVQDPWRLVAVVRDGESDAFLRVEYREHRDALPRSIRLIGGGARSGGSAAFNIGLTLSQIETNVSLDPQVFTVQIPPDTDPITLEELRRSGPLAPGGDGR